MACSRNLIDSLAAATSVAAAAGTAAGITLLARGDVRGAPGMSRALSRLGKMVGGGMVSGVALAAGSGAIVGLSLYRGLNRFQC
jgi:hypothetical protein